MTGEELGRILGDVISELQDASMEIEETVDMLLDIDGKVILLNESDGEAAGDQPSMTIDEFNGLIFDALSELESATAVIEDASGLLQSIEGSAIAADEPNDA